jgi:hypothetical protein
MRLSCHTVVFIEFIVVESIVASLRGSTLNTWLVVMAFLRNEISVDGASTNNEEFVFVQNIFRHMSVRQAA